MRGTLHPPPDQRPQLARMRRARRRINVLNSVNWIIILTIAILMGYALYSSVYLDELPRFLQFKADGITSVFLTSISILVVGMLFGLFSDYLEKKHIWFHCPNTSCKSGSIPNAINAALWQCGKCGHTHEGLPGKTWWSFARLIGDRCNNCKTAPSHFFCPHCNTAILLDETRPRTKAAKVPGWVRPPRPPGYEGGSGGPLGSFDSEL